MGKTVSGDRIRSYILRHVHIQMGAIATHAAKKFGGSSQIVSLRLDTL